MEKGISNLQFYPQTFDKLGSMSIRLIVSFDLNQEFYEAEKHNVKSKFADIADDGESWMMIELEKFDFSLFRHRIRAFGLMSL